VARAPGLAISAPAAGGALPRTPNAELVVPKRYASGLAKTPCSSGYLLAHHRLCRSVTVSSSDGSVSALACLVRPGHPPCLLPTDRSSVFPLL